MAQQDEGIMALMGAGAGAPAMGATPEDPPIDMYEFRKEAYPVFKDAVRDVAPEAYGEMQAMLSSEVAAMGDMDPEEIETMLEIVDYINENPEEYPQVREALISGGMIDADDFPAEMDVEYFATMEVVLQEALMQQRGEAAQMAQGPVEMMPPQGFAKGGIAEAAQLVASKGRYGDTMLAHITPAEARMLKAHGGSGTINPETGLPEYFRRAFRRVTRAVTRPIKAVAKAAKSVVKSVVSSPIGRIVATVGLSMIGVPPPLASALVTKAGGGSWKDALKSAAVSFLAGPSSPIASTVTRMTPFLSGLSPAMQAGIRSGLTATGAGLLTGSNLKDAAAMGITSGLMAGLQTRQDPAPVSDAAVMTPEQILAGDGTAPVSGGVLPAGTAIDPMTGQVTPVGGGATGPGTPLGPLSPDTAMQAATAAPTAAQAPLGGGLQGPASFDPSGGVNYGLQSPTVAPGGNVGLSDAFLQGQAQTTPSAAPTPADAGAARPLMDTLGQTARGAGQVLTGDFREGLGNIGTGLRETFMPSGEAGLMRTYGPAVAGGLGIMALTGGFEQQPLQESQFAQDMRQPIDVPPSLQRPIQNLPGVVYDEQGNIIGSQPWNPYASAGFDQRPTEVATPGIMSLPMPSAYLPPPGAPTMGQGQVFQPYNTASMYSNLMQPRRFNTGGVAALAQGGYPRRIGQISGPGTETSDDIPAMLSDGEFVMTARAVRGAGNGDRREGAKKMYAMMHQLERNAARG